MNTNKQLTKGNIIKKIFIFIVITITVNSPSQASEWKIISNNLNGYNFYTNKFINDKLINLDAKKLNNFIPGYTCNKSTTFQINCGPGGYIPPSSQVSWKVITNNISCNSETEFRFINNYTNPTYRCGNKPSIKWI